MAVVGSVGATNNPTSQRLVVHGAENHTVDSLVYNPDFSPRPQTGTSDLYHVGNVRGILTLDS